MNQGRLGTSRARLLLHRAIVAVARTLISLVPERSDARSLGESKVLIQAGRHGWELIEYQEILQSAIEYFGESQVTTNVVETGPRHVRRMRVAIQSARPEFVFLDPRSRDVPPIRRVFEAFATAIVLRRYGATPLVWLTDAAVRLWRLESEVISAERGAVFVFLHPTRDDIRFAHNRVFGPTPFPISEARILFLQTLRTECDVARAPRPQALFIGSLYEPRTTIVQNTQLALRGMGHDLILKTRAAGGTRMPNDNYWRLLASYAVVMTTGVQTWKRGMDRTAAEQLTFRYFEATAARCALVAKQPTGSEAFLQPERDYLAIDNYEQAAEAVAQLLENHDLSTRISASGFVATKLLATERAFWRQACRTQ